jgi:hypothetical protein
MTKCVLLVCRLSSSPGQAAGAWPNHLSGKSLETEACGGLEPGN